MKILYKNLLKLILIIGTVTTIMAQDYQPPLGIPAPEFGINEQLSDYYTRPDPWATEVAGWYYIDQYHPNASNSYQYGTPNNPLQRLPSSVPAGSVIEIHGTYDFAPIGYDVLVANGTEQAPVFVIGDEQTIVLRKWEIEASYTIIENMEFTNLGKLVVNYPSHHVSIRNNNLHDMVNTGKIAGSGNSDTQRNYHIVIYNNQIHSQVGWDQNPTVDLDNHGIKFGRFVDDVWVLDNIAYNNAGNFIQVGDDNIPANNQFSRRFYIGRNTSYANRQSPIGLKQASDIIISENILYNNLAIQANAAGQGGVEFQYGTGELWIINNHIYDSNYGITSGSDSDGIGENQYIIGNLIHDVHSAPSYNYNANTAWSPAAIMLAGGFNRHVVNNTIYNADAGINVPGVSDGSLEISNNIIYNTTRANHIFVEPGFLVSNAMVNNNIIYQPDGDVKIRWGSSTIQNVSQFEASYPGAGQNNLETEPLLQNPAGDNYGLQLSSAAIDAGIVSSVYQTFFDNYGLNINSDRNGTTRPIGNGWDIGAFELPVDLIFKDGFE